MDWNFFVMPNSEFSFLINEALPHKNETFFMSSSGWHKNIEGQYQIEAEVTPDQSLYDNIFFPKGITYDTINPGTPFQTIVKKKSNDPDINLEGKEVCFYGPWVREWFHHNRPEIHPSEMIWWKVA